MLNKSHFKHNAKTLPAANERVAITGNVTASPALLSLPDAAFEECLRMLRGSHLISLVDEAMLREMREVLE